MPKKTINSGADVSATSADGFGGYSTKLSGRPAPHAEWWSGSEGQNVKRVDIVIITITDGDGKEVENVKLARMPTLQELMRYQQLGNVSMRGKSAYVSLTDYENKINAPVREYRV